MVATKKVGTGSHQTRHQGGPRQHEKAAASVATTSPAACLKPNAAAATAPAARTQQHQQRVNMNGRALLMELGLFLLCVEQLGLQSYNLYRLHLAQYEFDILALATASLSRHLLLRYLGENLVSRKKLRRHLSAHPRISSAVLLLLLLPAISIIRLAWLGRSTCLFYCMIPILLSTMLFQPVPAPWPPDLLHLSGFTMGASSSSSGGGGGKAPRRKLAPYVIRYLAFRLIEAVYTSALLPMLVNQQQHLFFRRSRCFSHALIFSLQSLVLLLAMAAVLLRDQLFLEGEPFRRWTLLPPDQPVVGHVSRWRPSDQFPPGSVVVHRGKHYQASEAGCMANHLHTGPRTPEPPEGPVSTPLWLVYAAFSGEGMEPRTSPFLMVLQGVQSAGLLVLVYLMMTSMQWVPYSLMLLSSFESLALIIMAQMSTAQMSTAVTGSRTPS